MHTRHITYDVFVQMKFPNNASIHMQDGISEFNYLLFVSLYLYQKIRIRKNNICGCKYTPYDLITNILLCHICHISNDNIWGNEKILCEFICNVVQLGFF